MPRKKLRRSIIDFHKVCQLAFLAAEMLCDGLSANDLKSCCKFLSIIIR